MVTQNYVLPLKFTIIGIKYEVTDVQKAGKAILHYLDRELPSDIQDGIQVEGSVDPQRRFVLRNHHTGNHKLLP
jgi:alanyl-tRNA synthetase